MPKNEAHLGFFAKVRLGLTQRLVSIFRGQEFSYLVVLAFFVPLQYYPAFSPEARFWHVVTTSLAFYFFAPRTLISLLSFLTVAILPLRYDPSGIPSFYLAGGLLVNHMVQKIAVPTSIVRVAFLSTCQSMIVLLDRSGALWPDLTKFSWLLSGRINKQMLGQYVVSGPTHAGIYPLILMIPLLVFAIASNGKSVPRLVVTILSFLFGSILIMAFGSWLVLVCLTFLLAFLCRPGNVESVDEPKRRVDWTLLPVGLLMVLVASYGFFWVTKRPAKISIVQGGLKTLTMANKSSLDDAKDARFGALKCLAEIYGSSISLVPEVFGPSDIADADVLMIINPVKDPSQAQVDAVYDYLRKGGRVLVLGDHTDIMGLRGPVNHYLSGTSIRLNFDSAIPTDVHWKWKDGLRGSFAAEVPYPCEYGISVGASLDVARPAIPLAVADNGFSDCGNPAYGQSHLGNMQLDVGEGYGGLVLIASQKVGNGELVAFGDTAGFQDETLTFSHETIIRTLFNRPIFLLPVPLLQAGWILATILVALLPIFTKRSGIWLSPAMAVIFIALAIQNGINNAKRPKVVQNFAMLDTAHRPMYTSSDPVLSLYRLSESFERTGILLLGLKDFKGSLQQKPTNVVISAPSAPYSDSEIDCLEKYVSEGGTVLVCAGGHTSEQVRKLLHKFGFKLGTQTYGSAHNSRVVGADLRGLLYLPPIPSSKETDYDAEITFVESYPVYCDRGTTLVTCWGAPLVVRAPFGSGSITVIGDERFLTSKNLGEKQINATNVRFLLKLLEK